MTKAERFYNSLGYIDWISKNPHVKIVSVLHDGKHLLVTYEV